MSSRTTTPAPSFGRAAPAPPGGVVSGAQRHLGARLSLYSAGLTPLAGLATAAVAVSIFTLNACTISPLWLALCATTGSFLYMGNHGKGWGREPLLPVSHRTRIAVDAGIVTLAAVLPSLLLVLGFHAMAVGRFQSQVELYPGWRWGMPEHLDAVLLQGLGALLLSFPLLAAGMRLPPSRGSVRYTLPVLAPLALFLLGWSVGLTGSLQGSVALAGAMTAVLAWTSPLDWSRPLPWQALTEGLARRGVRARPGLPPLTRLARDHHRSLGRQVALVAAASVLGWILVSAAVSQGDTLNILVMLVVTLVFMFPRFAALAAFLELGPWAVGPATPYAGGPWALLPLTRRSLEQRALGHYLLIAVTVVVVDLVAVSLVFPQGISTSSAKQLTFQSLVIVLGMPWLTGFLHLVRFRWRGFAQSLPALLGLFAGLNLTAGALFVVTVGGIVGKNIRLGVENTDPEAIPAAMALVVGHSLVTVTSWALVLGIAWATMPREETP